MFFAQVEEFCRLVQREFLARFNDVEEIAGSVERALSFAETLMLCPTEEAVWVSIQRELNAALSFVVAIQALQRELEAGHVELPTEVPEHQTRFYLMSSSIRDFLQLTNPALIPTKPV
jgi:hypothetical protein